MPRASNTVTIARPVEAVFAFVADGETGPRWRGDGIEVQRLSGEGVGTRYAQRVPGPMGRSVAADYEITVFEPDRRIEFQTIAGPVRPHGRFDFESVEGGARVTFSIDASVTGLRGLLMGGMVQRSMDSGVASLEKLKRLLEA